MYPMLLSAPIKDYLWGGKRLINEFGFKTEGDKAAEAWMLSCHNQGMSTILNGEYKGQTLDSVIKTLGADFAGKKTMEYKDFPLLIKLIDAQNQLSIQVHPDDEYALKNEGEFGKTEMWYVVDAKPDSNLIYGFKQNISKEEFKKRIENNTLLQVCNIVPVKKGDMFFIPAGTLHAIGDGLLIAEIQQNSNSTYRVYDYNRKDANGNTRPLHIEKALDVTKTTPPTLPYGNVGDSKQQYYGVLRKLVECDLFTAEVIDIDKAVGLTTDENSFQSLVVLEGSAVITYTRDIVRSLSVKKGDSIFVPANFSCTIHGACKMICARL